MKRIAVFAHYDKDGRLSNNVIRLIESLETVCERIIMVSTNLLDEEIKQLPTKVQCFVRENVGYDFYSYKYGIDKIENIYTYDQLLLINDSFFVSSSFRMEKIIQTVDNSIFDICGLIDSYQFNYHVQSFFVALKKEAILSVWFKNFWDSVTVLDRKMDIIFKYEIGMSQSAMSHSLLVGSCFQWSSKNYWNALVNSYKKRNVKLMFLSIFSYKYLREGNASHLLWKDIYDEFSICKWEVVRNYPEAVTYIEKNNEDALEVKDYLNNKALFYIDRKIDDVLNNELSTQVYYSAANLVNRFDSKKSDVAVVLHLYYLELLDEIVSYLRNIPMQYDLYISVVSLGAVFEVEQRLKYYTNANVYVYCVENKGRDVAPFLALLNTEILERYTSVCKIHSKKSLYSPQGTNWRQRIYGEMLGSTSTVLSIVNKFKNDNSMGIIGPEESYLINEEFWGANKEKVYELCMKVGLQKEDITLSFFAGTMFWFNPKAISLMKNLNLTIDDFDSEKGMQDGTLAHAIERVFVPIARHNQYKILSVQDLEAEIQDDEYANQRVPVL
ncbi:rhamnan synthesis F family protein [Paenibacillus sp. CGMCC 1.18879]|uniref:rhamnan synthesis F family protein n=1 Tax=Paenibacillus sp. CGMCC 1.18879 TaxID=2834466 RepID=UPI001CA8ADDF|nr:rhamnan synthesis F family protein [Paenibacillus sp. CGMCC 1.18879]MBY9077522.1 hypothetical protein [Paenibacillus sp. CGMCC 1.18879]